MPYTLVVDRSNLGINSSHGEIFIHGLGAYDDGTYEISDEQEMHFRVVNSVDTGKYDDDPESESYGQYIPKPELGPDLVTASQGMRGVTVTEMKANTDTGNSQGPVDSSSSGAPADTGSES